MVHGEGEGEGGIIVGDEEVPSSPKAISDLGPFNDGIAALFNRTIQWELQAEGFKKDWSGIGRSRTVVDFNF
jgi:hypothetical protein